MTAIYKRELRSYFHSMIGYVFIAFLVAFAGIYFTAFNLNYGYPYFSYVLTGITFIYMIAIPVLTMRSFAEDRKNKTDQLLLTSPVSVTGVVVGKYLAMITILAVPCIIYLLFPLIIKTQGNAYLLVDYLSILAFYLLGCVYVSIGMFISSLTQSQILAAIGTFGILLVLYLWNGIIGFLPDQAWMNVVGIVLVLSVVVLLIWQMTKNWLICGVLELLVIAGNVITYAVKSEAYEGLMAGILGRLNLNDAFTGISDNSLLDISGIVLYLTLIVLLNFLTVQMIQKRRWS